jgi:hypothetical protein
VNHITLLALDIDPEEDNKVSMHHIVPHRMRKTKMISCDVPFLYLGARFRQGAVCSHIIPSFHSVGSFCNALRLEFVLLVQSSMSKDCALLFSIPSDSIV